MPTIKYFNKEGNRIPGMTTVLNSLGFKTGGLCYWNWERGKNGFDYWDKFDANVGTCMHSMIECDIKKVEFNPEPFPQDVLDAAETPYLSWLEWKEAWEFEPVAIEEHLVSEKYQVGGTPDCIPKVRNKLAMFDWKSYGGKGNTAMPYVDHKIQVRGYGLLWEENNPDQPITGGYHIVYFTKYNLGFNHWYRDASALNKCIETFEHARWLYDTEKELKKI